MRFYALQRHQGCPPAPTFAEHHLCSAGVVGESAGVSLFWAPNLHSLVWGVGAWFEREGVTSARPLVRSSALSDSGLLDQTDGLTRSSLRPQLGSEKRASASWEPNPKRSPTVAPQRQRSSGGARRKSALGGTVRCLFERINNRVAQRCTTASGWGDPAPTFAEHPRCAATSPRSRLVSSPRVESSRERERYSPGRRASEISEPLLEPRRLSARAELARCEMLGLRHVALLDAGVDAA
jgi:hypothetical protein